ncbi:glutathione S-transferase domain-containing protein [Leptodontidium sp. MPI-SDFR-AT-0119]|nr:glutathione S-transferase domain-containing protein [Leptodontidium sp. MPI-SDFR-AT-0119]
MVSTPSSQPKIKLYTNHGCPWSHRAHIALSELNLPFEEEIIDLTVPRTPEYLNINPRGVLPSLWYNGEIIIDSAIIVQFLADAHPSHLLPTSNSEGAALRRARINFFVDAYFTKVAPVYFKSFGAKSLDEAETFAKDFVDAVSKEVEPLLADAAPYFGGSDKLTLAEVLTASFIIRLFSLTKYGVLHQSTVSALSERTPNFYTWAQAVIRHRSVTSIYDESAIVQGIKDWIAKMTNK